MSTGDNGDDPPEMLPWNLALRFTLEVACVAGIGAGVGSATSLAIGVAAAAAALIVWGTFATPDDPSRSGKTPVHTPGVVRLAIELAVFGGGVAGWFAAGQPFVATATAVLLVVHHAAARPRLAWLIAQR